MFFNISCDYYMQSVTYPNPCDDRSDILPDDITRNEEMEKIDKNENKQLFAASTTD